MLHFPQVNLLEFASLFTGYVYATKMLSKTEKFFPCVFKKFNVYMTTFTDLHIPAKTAKTLYYVCQARSVTTVTLLVNSIYGEATISYLRPFHQITTLTRLIQKSVRI